MATSSRSDLPKSSEPPGSRRFTFVTRWYGWLLVLPLAVLLAVWVVKSRDQSQVAEPAQVLPVETTQLQAQSSYSVARSYTGEIAARRSSDLGFEQAGTVIDLLADDGDRVSAGEPLARLDTRDLEAQRQQLEARKRQLSAQLQELEKGPRREDIAAAQAAVSDLSNQLELAQLQAQRRATLYAQGAVAKEEFDEKQFGARAIADRLKQAQSQLDELRNGTRQEQLAAQTAQVDQIDANIRAIDIALDKSVLVAPFAGKISARAVDEGTVVGSGQTVMKLVENSQMEARVGVPVDKAEELAMGSQQRVRVGDRTYPAVVTARLPETNQASQTVTVVLEMAADDSLTAGATAQLAMSESQSEEGYWLPSTALVAGDRGLWSVYVLAASKSSEESSSENSGPYRVARRDVEVLYTEGERAFVRGLVQVGDRVITTGTQRVVADQLVQPINPPINPPVNPPVNP